MFNEDNFELVPWDDEDDSVLVDEALNERFVEGEFSYENGWGDHEEWLRRSRGLPAM